MIWFFERRGQHVRVETRLREDAEGFELVVAEAGSSPRLEYFEDERALLARHEEICRELSQSGWDTPAPGWRL
jgi:hypothetical protein